MPRLWTGGGPRNVYTLATHLAERGHDAAVLVLGSSLTGHSDPMLPISVNVEHLWHPLALVNQAAYVASRKRDWLIPVQQVINSSTLLTSAESAVYVATAWQSAFPVSRVSGMVGQQGMYFVQAYETTFSNGPIFKHFANKTYVYKLIQFTQSAWLARFLEENYGAKTYYVGMGINHDVFRPAKIVQYKPRIVTIARTDPNKGFNTFVKAIRHLYKMRGDFEVIIIGEKAAIDSQQIDFPYKFGGWVARDQELANLYQGSIFVNTGRHEALPMPPLEAMACAATVVMTDTKGAREYAVNGQNCLLAPVDDAKALANRISDVLLNYAMREELARNAMSTASRYDWDMVTTKFEEIAKKEGL
jgi:glycosyltransferase involved in cell wall biosynthesis